MRITGGQVFDLHEGFLRRDVCFDGRLLSDSSSDGKIYDAAGCYVIPGLTDLHFHGCKGQDFSDGDAGGLETMAKYELSGGGDPDLSRGHDPAGGSADPDLPGSGRPSGGRPARRGPVRG